MDKQIKELKECIDRSANTVAVTGAGISVSSGGMTFSHSSQKALAGVEKAQEMISKAELILVIGTNGPYSGAYWPYRNYDATVIQINPGHTPFDRVADLNIRRGADEVFDELFREEP